MGAFNRLKAMAAAGALLALTVPASAQTDGEAEAVTWSQYCQTIAAQQNGTVSDCGQTLGPAAQDGPWTAQPRSYQAAVPAFDVEPDRYDSMITQLKPEPPKPVYGQVKPTAFGLKKPIAQASLGY